MNRSRLLSKLRGYRGKKLVLRFMASNTETYDGVLLWVHASGFLFQEFRDLRADGLQFWPQRTLKAVKESANSALFYSLLKKNGELARRPRAPWLRKPQDLLSFLRACKKRDVWPIIEQNKVDVGSALYIGPLTELGTKQFKQFAYDAYGRWEKEYDLKMGAVRRIEVFDTYSTTFSAYMRKFPRDSK